MKYYKRKGTKRIGPYYYKHDANVFKPGAGVKSIMIEKETTGQATGFWKGITSTEA